MLELLHGTPDHDTLQLVCQTRMGSCPRQAAGSTEWCEALRNGLYGSPPWQAVREHRLRSEIMLASRVSGS